MKKESISEIIKRFNSIKDPSLKKLMQLCFKLTERLNLYKTNKSDRVAVSDVLIEIEEYRSTKNFQKSEDFLGDLSRDLCNSEDIKDSRNGRGYVVFYRSGIGEPVDIGFVLPHWGSVVENSERYVWTKPREL